MEHEIRGNGFRVGTVSAQDTARAKVRVTFPDRDQLVSYWLPVLVTKAQHDKFYDMPDIGEQVVCLMDLRDEAGCVLGAIYSSADTPPVNSPDKWHVTFKDTAVLEYDRNLHVLKHVAQDNALFKYDSVAHAMTFQLPNGAIATVTANGAEIQIDASGNVNISPGSGGQIVLAGGGPAIARVGDSVVVNDPDDGPITGHITGGSSKANCGG